jgi:Right handed beta helix region
MPRQLQPGQRYSGEGKKMRPSKDLWPRLGAAGTLRALSSGGIGRGRVPESRDGVPHRRRLTLLLLGLTLVVWGARTEAATEFFVAPNGSDAWSGRMPSANARRTDGPLASVGHGLEVIRDLRARNVGTGAFTLWLRGGIYRWSKPLVIGGADSASEARPTVIAAYRDEIVQIEGGVPVTGWRRLSDHSVEARLTTDARAHVLEAPVDGLVASGYGKLLPRGFGRGDLSAAMELFFNGRRMPLARWPNEGWLTIVGVESNPATFGYEGSRPEHWQQAGDIWVHGYWKRDWADSYERVRSLDASTHRITTEPPHGVYGYASGGRFYFVNVLEELDSPGEWYLDREHSLLYFWPPGSLTPGSTVVSAADSLMAVTEAAYITFRRLRFSISRATAVQITHSSHITLVNCAVRNAGTYAVNVRESSNVVIDGCSIDSTGDGGVILGGGERDSLKPSDNVIQNSSVTEFGQTVRTYTPAVKLVGVGNRIFHCRLRSGPHAAVLIAGNDNHVEATEISGVCSETDDCGAVYLGRDWTERGNALDGNWFHSIVGQPAHAGRVGVAAVYLDDLASGASVTNNAFTNNDIGVLIGGGRDNRIVNNAFDGCETPVYIDARGAAMTSASGIGAEVMNRLHRVAYDREPYLSKYPALASILSGEPFLPKGNQIMRNLVTSAEWLKRLGPISAATNEIRANVVVKAGTATPDERIRIREMQRDPAAVAFGFAALPLERVGPQ